MIEKREKRIKSLMNFINVLLLFYHIRAPSAFQLKKNKENLELKIA